MYSKYAVKREGCDCSGDWLVQLRVLDAGISEVQEESGKGHFVARAGGRFGKKFHRKNTKGATRGDEESWEGEWRELVGCDGWVRLLLYRRGKMFTLR